MCKKNFVLLILIFLSSLAYGQVNTGVNTSAKTVNNVAIARKNTELDEKKYAHPQDFIYEEKVEDVKPEDVEQNTYEQQIQEEEAIQEAVNNPPADNV